MWTVGADKTVSMRTVTQGATDNDKVSITKGLNAGETVVIDGADRLRDGSDVSIPAMGKAGMPPPPSAGGNGPAGQRRVCRRCSRVCRPMFARRWKR